jgi:quercetin dioxygenase-like cupin family protein
MAISEQIVSGQREPSLAFMPQVALRTFASAECGAKAMSTGTATFAPAERLPYHKHGFSEAVTILQGEAVFEVEGRSYLLRPLDCMHVPAGLAHAVVNASKAAPLLALWAFASSTPSRNPVPDHFTRIDRSTADPRPEDPEHIARVSGTDNYELAEGTEFWDLFAGRYGSVGICGGYGRFQPGSSLPCHIHDFDESITIVEGEATCQVSGRRYRLSGCDTAFVPQGTPHRFLNESQSAMAMIWVYAGSEPSRSIVDVEYCVGSRPWMMPRTERPGAPSERAKTSDP